MPRECGGMRAACKWTKAPASPVFAPLYAVPAHGMGDNVRSANGTVVYDSLSEAFMNASYTRGEPDVLLQGRRDVNLSLFGSTDARHWSLVFVKQL